MKLYGYEPSRKDQHYVKTTSVGRLNFHLSFIRHQTDFDVTGDVAVRFDRLEELLYGDCRHPSTPGLQTPIYSGDCRDCRHPSTPWRSLWVSESPIYSVAESVGV